MLSLSPPLRSHLVQLEKAVIVACGMSGAHGQGMLDGRALGQRRDLEIGEKDVDGRGGGHVNVVEQTIGGKFLHIAPLSLYISINLKKGGRIKYCFNFDYRDENMETAVKCFGRYFSLSF